MLPDIVFISGPLRGLDMVENVSRARNMARRLWMAGVPVICPHLNSGEFTGAIDEEVALAGYLDILVMCDAVVTTTGWEGSLGAREEVNCALEFGIPVYHSVEDYLETQK